MAWHGIWWQKKKVRISYVVNSVYQSLVQRGLGRWKSPCDQIRRCSSNTTTTIKITKNGNLKATAVAMFKWHKNEYIRNNRNENNKKKIFRPEKRNYLRDILENVKLSKFTNISSLNIALQKQNKAISISIYTFK